jgi:glycerol-3-phosphate dehydrogenase
VEKAGRLALAGHEQVRDHSHEGVDGLMSVAGVKYTTARASAERVVDRACAKLGRPAARCRTATASLPGGSLRNTSSAIADARREHDAGLPSDTIPHLVAAYGSRYEEVLLLARERREWRQRLADESPVIGAELVRAARSEMVVRLSDAVVRRTPLGALGYPGDAAAERAAAIVAAEAGWDSARTARELDALRAFYGIVNALKT